MSLLLALGGLISLTAVVTGVSVTIAKSKTDHSTTSQTKTKQEEKFEPTVLKKCTVFLTNTNDSYTIVSCENDQTNWYLFDKERSTLDKIAGISTPNIKEKQVGYPIDLWKDREWMGFSKWDSIRYTGNGGVGKAFPIDYAPSAKEFPFFEYVKSMCSPTGVALSRTSSYVCTSLSKIDIPDAEFKKPEKKTQFKETFNHNSESRCYGQNKSNKWQVINCNIQIKSQ